jgi:hypothetical protein
LIDGVTTFALRANPLYKIDESAREIVKFRGEKYRPSLSFDNKSLRAGDDALSPISQACSYRAKISGVKSSSGVWQSPGNGPSVHMVVLDRGLADCRGRLKTKEQLLCSCSILFAKLIRKIVLLCKMFSGNINIILRLCFSIKKIFFSLL